MVNNINTNGNFSVAGDFHDNSNSSNLIVNLSNDQLLEEGKHRREVLKDLCQKRVRVLLILLGIAALLAAFAFASSQYMDLPALVTVLSGAASVVTIMGSFKALGSASEDERRQVNALELIRQIQVDRRTRR